MPRSLRQASQGPGPGRGPARPFPPFRQLNGNSDTPCLPPPSPPGGNRPAQRSSPPSRGRRQYRPSPPGGVGGQRFLWPQWPESSLASYSTLPPQIPSSSGEVLARPGPAPPYPPFLRRCGTHGNASLRRVGAPPRLGQVAGGEALLPGGGRAVFGGGGEVGA